MAMTLEEILSKCDHTLLVQDATKDDIKSICDDGIKFKTASICISPSYVEFAKHYIETQNADLKICTVIGFPNGNCTTETKIFEARDTIEKGADEIDMVINIGRLKDKDYTYILNEIKQLRNACEKKILKVIIETCYLTDDEKIKMCEIVTEARADFIKTSTGFGTGGATFEDVALFAKYINPDVKIKAAGGISNLEDAEKFIELGASRLGTSRIVKIAKNK